MQKRLATGFALIVALTLSTACARFIPAKAVATVGGEKITVRQLNTRVNIYKLIYSHQFDTEEAKGKILDQMIEETMVAQEAKRQNVKPDPKELADEKGKLRDFLLAMVDPTQGQKPPGENPKPKDPAAAEAKLNEEFKKLGLTQTDLDYFIERIMVTDALYKNVTNKVSVTDEDARAYYEAHKADRFTTGQISARHILITSSEADAKKVEAEVKAPGADFEALAKKYSQDPGSKDKGGVVPPFDAGTGRTAEGGAIVPEFRQAAAALKPGEISAPTKSQFGWHIIRVDKNESRILPFEEAKENAKLQVTLQKQSDAWNSFIENLRKNTKVTRGQIPASK
ncbi:MAG: peptidylprolyl isomerase [Actinobacteria bacterium]|nr:peptidylprolyl isomerase [Actinomycetota bacterium]